MFAAGTDWGAKRLSHGGCFGLRALCEKHSAYSLALSASALMGAAFGSGMGGREKICTVSVKYGF